jgi:hypothetical protein
VPRDQDSCHDRQHMFASFVHSGMIDVRFMFVYAAITGTRVTLRKQVEYSQDVAFDTGGNVRIPVMHTRRKYYRAIFGRWWGIVNGLWTLLSSVETLVDHYASKAFQESWNAAWIAPKWGWRVWGLGVVASTAVFAIEYSYRCIRQEESKTETEQQKLDQIEKAKPKIKLKDSDAVYTEPIAQRFTDSEGRVLMQRVDRFLKVRFINDPDTSLPAAKAQGIMATISYYRCPENAHIFSIDGRWSESTQPSGLPPLESKVHLLPADFGHGQQRSLDIAYKDGKSGKYYAWNNDNYNLINQFYEYPRHLLEGKHFRVEIRLRGVNVDEQFSFEFRTSFAEKAFDIDRHVKRHS